MVAHIFTLKGSFPLEYVIFNEKYQFWLIQYYMQTIAHLNKSLVRLIRKNSQYNKPSGTPVISF
jgi:hypothetical protein